MICAFCTLSTFAELCPHHVAATSDWCCTSNRIWCDFIHRGVTPDRLTLADRVDSSETVEESVA